MSRTADRFRLRWHPADDEGFTLVEVIAAIAVFAIVASMALVLLLSAIKASAVAKADTVGRNLAQAKLEELRNLPYHIDASINTNGKPVYDLLDLYYKNASGSVGRGVTGYVPATATRWTADGDPATGAFYRSVVSSVTGYAGYQEYVTVQFVDNTAAPVAPGSTFDTTVSGSDAPVTNQVAVGVTAFWKVGTAQKSYSIASQISGGPAVVPKVNMQVQGEVLSISGGLPSGSQGSLDLATLDLNASSGNIVTAGATARGAAAAVEGGASATGAVGNVSAPPNASLTTVNSTPNSAAVVDTSTVAGFAGSDASGVAAGSSNGQPYAGSSSSPVVTDLLSNGNGGYAATFSNESTNTHLGLASDKPVVVVENTSSSCGACPTATAQGYSVASATSTTHTATSSATVNPGTLTTTIDLFPTLANTALAPTGVVQIQLSTASISCTTTGTFGSASTASASLSYSARLRYAKWDTTQLKTVYSGWLTLGSSVAADPLATVDLATIVGYDSASQAVKLSDYITSWSSLTSGALSSTQTVQTTTDNKFISAHVSGVISVNSAALRSADVASTTGVSLAPLSCLAEDHR